MSRKVKGYLFVKEHEIPLYRGKLVVILSNDASKVKKLLPHSNYVNIYAHSITCNWKGSLGYVAIINLNNEYRGMKHGCIAHEAVHLAHFILGDRGHKSDFDNDEAEAYLTEWITDRIYDLIKKKGLYRLVE